MINSCFCSRGSSTPTPCSRQQMKVLKGKYPPSMIITMPPQINWYTYEKTKHTKFSRCFLPCAVYGYAVHGIIETRKLHLIELMCCDGIGDIGMYRPFRWQIVPIGLLYCCTLHCCYSWVVTTPKCDLYCWHSSWKILT